MNHHCRKCGGLVTLDYDPDSCHQCNGWDEHWDALCAEVRKNAQAENARIVREAYERNPRATSADILGDPTLEPK